MILGNFIGVNAAGLARLLAALNIPHVGVSTAALLAEHFGTMEAIEAAGPAELQEMEGIGPELAESIHNFLHKNTHTTGDAFILWRLKLILSEGEYDTNGELKGMKDFEVKQKSVQPETTA
jgi:NAD-dependent DNA ligase